MIKSKYVGNIIQISLFFAAVFFAFGHSLYQGYAPVDDIFLIVENLAIRGMTWENLWHVFSTYDPELYIPLVFVSYQINWMISGIQPFGFHLTNILLHAVNALLVARILFQLSNKKWLSVFAGLIFAVHPLNTEAVVWLAGRKDLLSAIFFFAAFTFYLDSVKGSQKAYFASIIFFALALFSKIIAVTLFGIIILHLLVIKRSKLTKTTIISLIPYAFLSVIFMIIAIGGKARIVAAVSTWGKMLVAGKSTAFYIQKLIFPTDLSIIYPLQGNISLSSLDILIPVIFCVFLIIIAIINIRKRPWITFGIGWYIITLSPTYLNIGKAGLVFFAVDRYAYLPSVGILFILVCILGVLSKNIHLKNYSQKVWMTIPFLLVIIIFASMSRVQTKVWDTPEGIYLKTLSIYPESIGARSGLSSIYRHQNRLEEAFEVLREGLKYGEHSLLDLHAGYIYAKTGQITEAIERFEEAVQKDPQSPEPLFALGSLYEKTGRPEKSIKYYNNAIALDDSYVIVRARLANIYIDQNKLKEARNQLVAALQWNANSYEANLAMVKLLELEGNLEEVDQYKKKIEMIE